jgi:hypothetical protein
MPFSALTFKRRPLAVGPAAFGTDGKPFDPRFEKRTWGILSLTKGHSIKLRAAFVLVTLSLTICAPASAEKPNYPLTAHVVSSDYSISCNSDYMCYGLPKLNVTIDGKKYFLASENAAVVTGINLQGTYLVNVLKNGDYPARIVKDEAENSAEYHRVIELQVASGVTRRYTVIGEGAN